MTGEDAGQRTVTDQRTSGIILLLLVAMTGIAPVSLYMLVPALPVLTKAFSTDIGLVQMTVSLYMVGLALSQIIMGPLSDRYGRRPVLLGGLALMIAANIACIFATSLPQLVVLRFFQALGGASGMVISRAIIRDLYGRDRVGAMISLVIAVMMIAQMLSPLLGGLIEIAFGWRAIFTVVAIASVGVTAAIALGLPETRRRPDGVTGAGFAADLRALMHSRAFFGYVLCQVLASSIIFVFAGAGPYVVVTQMGRSTAEYGAWFATSGVAYLIGNLFCVRFASRYALDRLIWFGLAIQIAGALLNLVWGIAGLNGVPSWLFITHMIIMFANAFVMSNSAAGAISIRPQAAGTASGAMGFLQMGLGALFSQLGAWLGGHFATPLALNAAIVVQSLACAAMMAFLVPRTRVIASDELRDQADGEETGLL